jgi:hypothetical protein
MASGRIIGMDNDDLLALPALLDRLVPPAATGLCHSTARLRCHHENSRAANSPTRQLSDIHM